LQLIALPFLASWVVLAVGFFVLPGQAAVATSIQKSLRVASVSTAAQPVRVSE